MYTPAHGASGSQLIWILFCAHARAYARKDSHSHRLPSGHSHVSVTHELKQKENQDTYRIDVIVRVYKSNAYAMSN